jgi:hypothetical protein
MSLYPTNVDLRHGGQIRLRNIQAAYERAGFNVASVGICMDGIFGVPSNFLTVPIEEVNGKTGIVEPWNLDLAIAKLIEIDDFYFNHFRQLLPGDISVIHVEQPWLFPLALRCRRWIGSMPPIIYGSQNIESQVRLQYLRELFPEKDVLVEESYLSTLDIEMSAIRGADLIATVSQSDKEWMSSRTQTPLIMAGNGVDYVASGEPPGVVSEQPFALYIASAHPPNLWGFMDLVLSKPGLFADLTIKVVGDVSLLIEADQHVNAIFSRAPNIQVLGFLSEDVLHELIEQASCIILPVKYGGGSNLKTAQAIVAGKNIVGTRYAFRGYEEFLSDPRITIAECPGKFSNAVRRTFRMEETYPSQYRNDAIQKLTWASQLENLAMIVRNLCKGPLPWQ